MPSLKESINSLNTEPNSALFFKSNRFCHKSYDELFKAADIVYFRLLKLLEHHANVNYVGLFIKHNLYIPPIILGCIKSDKPFVCMDVEAGKELNLNLIRKLCVTVLFTLSGDSGKLKQFMKSPSLFEEFEIWDMKVQLWTNGEVRKEKISTQSMLYAIQTSGSTGEPKIVQVPEQAILPNISHLRSAFGITVRDVILLASPPTFDPFMVELLLAWTAGASLLVAPGEVWASPSLLLDTLFPADAEPLVTVMQLTPSVFMRWTPQQIRTRILTAHTPLRVLALGGERFPPAKFWEQAQPPDNQTQVFSLYGTTELSCWATLSCGLTDTLGSPMSHTLLRVQTDEGSPVEEGTGHLFIGSETRICVVEEEDWQQLQPPVYRATGDIVNVKDGVYRYIGRKDNMVKRWGHRVSLDQVEAVAAECTEVTAACCVLHADSLALFVSLATNCGDIDKVKAKLRPLLLSRLNKASVPDVILREDHLPLTRHGKINKHKLRTVLSEMKNDDFTFEKPIDLFRALWKKYTIEYDGGENTGFLDGGGSSIVAMQIVNAMTVRGVEPSSALLAGMLNNESLDKCCRLLESQDRHEVESALVTRRSADDHDGPETKKAKSESDCVERRGSIQYLLDNIADDSQLRVLWAHNLGKCVDGSPTRLVYTSGMCHVVVGSHSGRLAAMELSSGALVWSTQLPDRIESSLSPSHCGSYGLVGCYDGCVYCVSLKTGSVVWSFRTHAMVKGTALAVDLTWVFGSYDYNVYCVTVPSGELVWRYKTGGIVLATPLPLPSSRLVVVASLSGQVTALSRDTGAVAWQTTLPSPVFSSPSVVAGWLLVAEVEGILHALHPDSGSRGWKFQVGGKIFSSLTVVASEVMFGCHDGLVYHLQASRQGARLLRTYAAGSAVYATPCLLTPHHLAAASTAGRLFVVDLTSGHTVASIHLPGHVFSSPVVFNNYITMGCRDDHLYCLTINKD